MGLTNFPQGASSFGIPLTGGGFIPAGGKHYFVNPSIGSNGNSGLSPDKPLDTVEYALSLCRSGYNDTIHLIGNGQASGSSRDTATLAWSKDAVHLVGECSPTRVSQRARISPSTTFTPLITVSGDGCMFSNVQFFQGHNAASLCVNVTGERNYFENCHFAGIGHATAGDDASSSSLSLTGDGENTFVNCVIGLDTVARSTSNAEIDFKSAAVRNTFINCDIIAFADNAGHLFLKADSSGDLDRYTIFDRCRFINATSSTATTMTAGISMHATVGGMIVLHDCALIGATDWTASDNTNVKYLGPGSDSATPTFAGIAATIDVS